MEVLAEISGHVESKWLLNTTHSILTSLWRPQNKFVPLTITGSSVYDESDHRAVLIPPSALSPCLQSQTRKAETEAARGLCIFLQQAQHTVWVPVGGTAGAWNTQMGLIPPSQKPCIAPVLSSIIGGVDPSHNETGETKLPMAYIKNHYGMRKHKDRKTTQAGAQLLISAAQNRKERICFF